MGKLPSGCQENSSGIGNRIKWQSVGKELNLVWILSTPTLEFCPHHQYNFTLENRWNKIQPHSTQWSFPHALPSKQPQLNLGSELTVQPISAHKQYYLFICLCVCICNSVWVKVVDKTLAAIHPYLFIHHGLFFQITEKKYQFILPHLRKIVYSET